MKATRSICGSTSIPPSPPARSCSRRMSAEAGHTAPTGARPRFPMARTRPPTAYHHAGDLPKAGEWVRLSVPAAAIGLAPGAMIGQLACTQFDGLVHWDNVGLHTSHPDKRLAHLPAEAIALLKAETPDPAKLAAFHRQSTPEWQKLSREITRLEHEHAALLTTAPTVPATVSAAPPRDPPAQSRRLAGQDRPARRTRHARFPNSL
jgi:hypothetical protein